MNYVTNFVNNNRSLLGNIALGASAFLGGAAFERSVNLGVRMPSAQSALLMVGASAACASIGASLNGYDKTAKFFGGTVLVGSAAAAIYAAMVIRVLSRWS